MWHDFTRILPLPQLGLQDWATPGKNRERKLTEAGKQYGVALLATLEGKGQRAKGKSVEISCMPFALLLFPPVSKKLLIPPFRGVVQKTP